MTVENSSQLLGFSEAGAPQPEAHTYHRTLFRVIALTNRAASAHSIKRPSLTARSVKFQDIARVDEIPFVYSVVGSAGAYSWQESRLEPPRMLTWLDPSRELPNSESSTDPSISMLELIVFF